MKVYVVGGHISIERMLREAGYHVQSDMGGADLVVFTGGADVDPALYGERNVSSFINKNRDAEEKQVFEWCTMHQIKMVGICRGAQFLNVMSGGKMWQDVDHHGVSGTHAAWCNVLDKTVQVTSTHHQMMRPSEEGRVLMTASRSSYKKDQIGVHLMTKDDVDVEVVYYPDSNCLCYQPHPENFRDNNHECTQHFLKLLDMFLIGTL